METTTKTSRCKGNRHVIMDIKELKNAAVYFSFTSEDGTDYAYLYMIVNRKFYWIDENYNVAEPLSQDSWDSYLEECSNGNYDEQYNLDSYDSLDELLEEFGKEKMEGVEEEGSEYPEYLSNNGEYVISIFVGEGKICEKVIQ